MFSLEEMASWTLEEVRHQIKELLPKGHKFGVRQLEGDEGWEAHYEDAEGNVLWRRSGLDERVLLLDAFGWLFVQQRSRPAPGSPWNKRPPVAQQPIEHRPVEIPDPEDLDPAEVLAVYGYGPKKT